MKRTHSLCLLIAVIIVIFTFAAPVYSGTVHVHLLKDVAIKGEKVTLGQIARIKGNDKEMVHSLKEIDIARTPRAGHVLNLNKTYILSKIRQATDSSDHLRLEAPERVSIKRDCVVLSKEEILGWVTEELLSRIHWPRDLVKVKGVNGLRDVVLPRGEISREILLSQKGLGQSGGSIRIIFRVDGKIRESLWATAKIVFYRPIVVASRPLDRNVLIGPEDVRIQIQPFKRSNKTFLTALERAVGKVTRRAITMGQPLTDRALQSPLLVKPKNIVRLVAERGLLRVTTLGQVKDKGGRGDMVRVLNLSSKKLVYGRVVDSRTIRVEF